MTKFIHDIKMVNKKIKIGLCLVFAIVLLSLLLFLGSLTYYIKGIIGGGKMLGDAIHQSELQAGKYDETNSPEACEKLGKELGVKYSEHPNVKNGTCPNYINVKK